MALDEGSMGEVREQDNRKLATAVGLDSTTAMAPKLGAGLAESGAQMARTYQTPDGKMGVTFVRSDGSEVDLTGVPAFVAGIVGGFIGLRKK